MSKKRMRNPTYAAGLSKGIEIGKNKTFDVVKEVLTELCDEKGIGPVMQGKIIDALGEIPRKVSLADEDFEKERNRTADCIHLQK